LQPVVGAFKITDIHVTFTFMVFNGALEMSNTVNH